MINAKVIKEMAEDVKVLYVEDDLELRDNTMLLLTKFFNSVDAAKDGEEGLSLYRKHKHDLVISDINMPKMDGITMSRAIKMDDPEQYILITSAHDESEHLMNLIDAGIEQFILKPLEVEKFLKGIYRAVKAVSDRRLLKEYSDLLEHNTIELMEKNRELEKLNKIFKHKIISKTVLKRAEKTEEKTVKQEVKPAREENYMEYIMPSDIEELSDLEEEVDSAISMMVLSDRFEMEYIETITQRLEKMSSLLYGYPIFMELSVGIRDLVTGLKGIDQENDLLFKKISIYLESFIFVLTKWKNEVLIEGVANPNMYDSSLLNDIKMVCERIDGTESDGGDMELF